MKTYCWMFYDKEKDKHFFQYFNSIEEVLEFLNDNKKWELLSLQRIFKIN